MARSKTPSFIFEQKLLTSRQDERVLDLRFRCVWHIKLQLVKHARRQISKYLDDPYRKTLVSERSCLLGKNGRLSVKRRTEISHALNDIRLSYGLSQYQFKLCHIRVYSISESLIIHVDPHLWRKNRYMLIISEIERMFYYQILI